MFRRSSWHWWLVRVIIFSWTVLRLGVCWAGWVLAILMGQTQPKLASVSSPRPARPVALYITSVKITLESGWLLIMIIHYVFLIVIAKRLSDLFISARISEYSTNLLDLVSLNNSVKLFHQIKNLSEEFSLYFDVSIRLIRFVSRLSRPVRLCVPWPLLASLISPKLTSFVTPKRPAPLAPLATNHVMMKKGKSNST